MSELRRIQIVLQQHLLNPTTDSRIVDAEIIETENVPRAVRLHIYANAYRVRVVEALAADFAMLQRYLGDDTFAELIDVYIDTHPSRHYSFRNVGGKLAEFLKSTEPYSAHIDLYELAQFEWALCHAFDAADDATASTANFAALTPEQWPELKLPVVRSLRVIELCTNAPAIWKALNAEQSPPDVEIGEPQCWVVWRCDLKLLFRQADKIETIALTAFANNHTFGDVCEILSEYLPETEVPQRAVGLLQQWLQDGLIAVDKN
ncbi:MAG TPA: DNA-binding domain-containing protein [Spongiibacteraceae bacterium]